MNEWLDGFETAAGRLCAVIRTSAGSRQTSDMGSLCTDGVPAGGVPPRKAFATNFEDWERDSTARYLSPFALTGVATDAHEIYRFRIGRLECLVPALVVLRGLFPLIPDALAYAFTPRPLEALCIPLSRACHWTVAMPNFTGLFRGRFRRPTLESLTWATVFPSARQTWQSVFRAASEGRMAVDLPKASARILLYGVRLGNVVHVTDMKVSSILAQEAPLDLAAGVSPSFLMCTNTEPLAPDANAYYEYKEPNPAAEAVRLTDDEWDRVRAFCERPEAPKGRRRRDMPRDIADALVIRAATLLPWTEIPVPIAGSSLAGHAQDWRNDGRLQKLYAALNELREDAPYLRDGNAERKAQKHTRRTVQSSTANA